MFIGLLTGSPVRLSRRTQGEHLSIRARSFATSYTDPSASRNTFSVTTITDRNAQIGGRSTFPALTLAWLYIEPSPCGGVRPAGDPVDSDPGAVFEDDPHPKSSRSSLRPSVCHHTREPTVLSTVSCRPFHLNVDRFHQPCLSPWRTSYCHRNTAGLGRDRRTVVPVPRGGHLPFFGQPGSPSFATHWRYCHADKTVPRQDVNSSFSPCVCHPWTRGVCTHAGSGPSRVLLSTRLFTTSPWHRSPLIYFWLLSSPTLESFPSFSHSLSTAAFAAGIFMAWGRGKFCVPNYNVAKNCPPFSQYGPHDNLVEILLYAVLWIHWLPRYTQFLIWNHGLTTGLPMLTLLACRARHSGSHRCFQFFASILNGFFEFLVLRVNEINSS